MEVFFKSCNFQVHQSAQLHVALLVLSVQRLHVKMLTHRNAQEGLALDHVMRAIPKLELNVGNCLRIKRTILIPSLPVMKKEPSLPQSPAKQSKIGCFSWQGVKECGLDWLTFWTKVITPGWMVPSLTTQTGTMASQTTGMETSTVCTCAVQMGSGMTLSVKGWSLSSARKQRDHSKES